MRVSFEKRRWLLIPLPILLLLWYVFGLKWCVKWLSLIIPAIETMPIGTLSGALLGLGFGFLLIVLPAFGMILAAYKITDRIDRSKDNG